MEIFLGLFILWLGYSWGRYAEKKTPVLVAEPLIQQPIQMPLQAEDRRNHFLSEWQTLYQAGVFSADCRDQLWRYYYPVSEQSVSERQDRSPFVLADFACELNKLQLVGVLSSEELQACLAYYQPAAESEARSSETLPETAAEASTVLKASESTPSDVGADWLASQPQSDPLKPYGRPDVLLQLLEVGRTLSHQRWSQALIGLGVVSIVLSSLPVIQHMSSATLIYLVLLLYTAGLLGAGMAVVRSFPWTGQVLSGVTLLILPLDYASLVSLDLAQPVDLGVSLLALLGLPALAFFALKTLRFQPDKLYLLVLLALGWSSALFRGLEPFLLNSGLPGSGRMFFEYLCVILPWAWVFLVLFRQNRQLWLLPESGENNFLQTLSLNGYLVFAAFSTPVIYAVAWPLLGLALGLTALALIWSAFALRQLLSLLLDERWPGFFWRLVREQEISAWLVLACGVFLAAGDPLTLALTAGPGALAVFATAYHWRQHWVRWPLYVYTAVLLSFALLGLGSDWQADGLSLVIAALALSLTLWGRLAPADSWRREALHQLALFLSASAWLEMAVFRDWSWQTLLALACLAGVYLRYAAHSGRNLFGYIGIVTGAISLLSILVLWQPEMPFKAYRFYVVGLAWAMLGLGLLIQVFTPRKADSGDESTSLASEDLWGRLNADRYHPFRFRQRFANLNPYLYSEPLYNLALLLTSVVTLTGLGDLRLTGLATLFYAVIFAIYPARLWVYFVIVTASDNALKLSGELLPERYQSWSLLILGLGWFFVGKLVEEILEGRDRKHLNAAHEAQKRFAKPFFHGAIFINVLLLRYFFGDLQNLFSEEGWQEATEEALPVLLTSVFYLLNLRVYVSKLWLYPGIISLSLGLYFGLTGFLPVEATLLIFSGLGAFWLWLARYTSAHSALNQWWQALIVYRLPDLEPESAFARIHLRDLSSPFWTFGLITVLCSLAFSALLIPWRPLALAQSFELALLTRSDPAWLFALQALNFFGLALLFFKGAHPRKQRLLWLDGMGVVCLTLGFAWLLQEQARPELLPVFLSGAGLFWSGLWFVLGRGWSVGSQRVLAVVSLALLGLAFVSLGLTREPWIGGLTLALLVLGSGLRLCLKPHYWQLYALSLLSLIGLILLKDGLHMLTPTQAALMPLLGGGLFTWLFLKAEYDGHGSEMSETSFSLHYLGLGLFWLGVQTLVQGALCWRMWQDLTLAQTQAPPEWGWLVVLLAVGIALCLRQLNVALLNPWVQGAALAQVLLGLLLTLFWQPLLLWGLLLLAVWFRRFFVPTAELLRWAWFASLLAPAFLALGMYFKTPELSGLGLLSWRLVPLVFWAGFYGREARMHKGSPWLWWLSVLTAYAAWLVLLFTDLGWFNQLQSLIGANPAGVLLIHAILQPFALALVWLAWYTLKKQPDRNQLFYLGLTLLVLPGFSCAFFADSLSLRLGMLLELALLTGAMIYTAFGLQLRAFLHVALVFISLALVGAVLAILLLGHWSLRWGLFISAGLGLMVAGNLLQSRNQALRLNLEKFQTRLLSWD
ncbi:MAG: hypothetical protein AB7I41_14155 [Candidatus Sericytochromatia bacterium]